jgi:hypothetical protein
MGLFDVDNINKISDLLNREIYEGVINDIVRYICKETITPFYTDYDLFRDILERLIIENPGLIKINVFDNSWPVPEVFWYAEYNTVIKCVNEKFIFKIVKYPSHSEPMYKIELDFDDIPSNFQNNCFVYQSEYQTVHDLLLIFNINSKNNPLKYDYKMKGEAFTKKFNINKEIKNDVFVYKFKNFIIFNETNSMLVMYKVGKRYTNKYYYYWGSNDYFNEYSWTDESPIPGGIG